MTSLLFLHCLLHLSPPVLHHLPAPLLLLESHLENEDFCVNQILLFDPPCNQETGINTNTKIETKIKTKSKENKVFVCAGRDKLWPREYSKGLVS